MDNFATKAFAIFIFLTSTMGILSLMISMIVEKDYITKPRIRKKSIIKTNQTISPHFDEVDVIFPEEDNF